MSRRGTGGWRGGGTPLASPGEGPHGATAADGRIAGAYVHGLFQAGAFRAAFLESFDAHGSRLDHGQVVEAALDEIAGVLEQSLDLDRLMQIANLKGLDR